MPKIGLLSDSHGRDETTRHAVSLLLRHGAQWLIHLGDLGTPRVIDALVIEGDPSGQPASCRLVFGNTDGQIETLGRYASELGIIVDHPAGRVEVDGRILVFTHGHDQRIMAEAVSDEVAYLCYGHSHQPRDERIGKTRLINPGALFRARRHTVAMLDTAADQVIFYFLDDNPSGCGRVS